MTTTTETPVFHTDKDRRYLDFFTYDPQPDLFNRKVKLPNDYLSRVANFMVVGENGQLFQNKGKTFTLSVEDEKLLFYQFNHAKAQMAACRANENWESFARWEAIAVQLMDTIFNANIFLLPTVAKLMNGWQAEIQDLVAEGGVTLMNCVHKFDVETGNKFSSFAYGAIKHSMIRWMVKKQNRSEKANQHSAEMIHRDQTHTDDKDSCNGETFSMMHEGIQRVLNETERQIINSRYPSGGGAVATLQALGDDLGLSKERIRQIEVAALGKLRQWMVDADMD